MKHLKKLSNEYSFNFFIDNENYVVPNITYTQSNKSLNYINKIKYEFIDLGLPSGTLWCNKNIGAKNVTDIGQYFAWGENKGYYQTTNTKQFSKNDYKYYNSSNDNYIKYIDNKTKLENCDNPVRIYIGKEYDIPEYYDFQELISNTNQQYISNYNNSGINGILLTSKNNTNSIFIPFGCVIQNGVILNKTTNPSAVIWYITCDPNGGTVHTLYIDNWGNSLRLLQNNTRDRFCGANFRAIKRS